MDKWSWILLLGGIAIGGVVVYLFFKPVQVTATSSPVLYTYKAKPVMSNLEVLEWTDYKGRNRTLKIHREVKRSV